MVRVGPGSGVGGAPGGGSDDSGGSSGGSTSPDNDAGRVAPDPVDGGGSDDSGGSSGGTSRRSYRPESVSGSTTIGTDIGAPTRTDASAIGDSLSREGLRSASQSYTESVAEPVGDFVANSAPVTTIERNITGTNVSGSFLESAGETAAQIGNIPGAITGTIDAAETARDTAQRQFDPVTINGAPTGVYLPDPEGQQAVGADTTRAAAGAAAGAAANPAESAGTLAGALLGGAAGGAAASRATRAFGASGRGTSASQSVATGRSQVGTRGVDNLFSADEIDELTGASGPSTASRARGTLDRAATSARERIDDLSGDFVDDTRAQTGQFRTPDTDSAPDRFTDFDRTDRVSDNLVQQSLNRQQRAGRSVVDDGDFEFGRDPFGPGSRRGTISESGDVDLGRSTAVVEDTRVSATTGGSGFGTEAAAGLGVISSTNDPTAIAQFDGADAGSAPASVAGGRADEIAALGTLAGANDVTGIGSAGGAGAETNSTTEGISDTGVNTDTGVGGDSDTRSGTDTEPIPQTVRGTTTLTTTASTSPSRASTADPTTAPAGVAGGAGGAPPSSTPAPRGRGKDEAKDDDGEEVAVAGINTSDALFGSGIASADDFL